MPLPNFQNYIDNAISDASKMNDSALVASFPNNMDFVDFINFDRDSLIDLYVQHVVFDNFDIVYPFMRDQLSQGMAS